MKTTMTRLLVVCMLFLLTGCDQSTTTGGANEPNTKPVSDLKADETLVFFQTSGWLDSAKQEWNLPVHGWIYEPQDSRARKTAFEKVLGEKFDLDVTAETNSNFSRRVNLLIADNERGKEIVINIAGLDVTIPASAENGHFETLIKLPAAMAEKHAQNGVVPYSAMTSDAETRSFTGAIKLLKPQGLSIISDIDDTVKLSHVTDRRKLIEHTFLLDFAAAPGMAKRYREWATNDIGFHFVSSSPWQLYEPLVEFLEQEKFPWATFSLKSIRFRDSTLLDLFKKGTETKPLAIKKILDRYPERKFILIGDSGEQDPKVYADLMRERPQQIRTIYIRNVTQETADNERFTEVFKNIERASWQLFDDPQQLTLPPDT